MNEGKHTLITGCVKHLNILSSYIKHHVVSSIGIAFQKFDLNYFSIILNNLCLRVFQNHTNISVLITG